MGIVYTEGAGRRGMSLRRYVDVTSTNADFHVADYRPWEGWEVTGWPATTIVQPTDRAEWDLLGKPGDGQLVKRAIERRILEWPAL
jgi:dihydropyrimidinase